MKKIMGFITIMLSILLVGCSTNSTSSSTQSKSNSSKVLKNQIKVSANDAIKLYQKTYPKTSVTSLELEKSYRGPVYKIEGIDEQKEYQLNINARNKKILQNSQEELDEDDQDDASRKSETLDVDDLISIKKAAKIAEDKIGGGVSTEFSLDKDLGKTYWEVTVKKNSTEKSVKINAQTGKILEVENDD
ncbi:PepSY domain-containing protein [Companilactobacillus sp. HBUAS59544]|jgi:uncharacterized membrane protein YkoI|uniref:PepSY domain-containing protein n=1 Tax=Companilactobacillus sp. HBUAS59544 TaxID=3109363 RepID=UPI002FEE6B18